MKWNFHWRKILVENWNRAQSIVGTSEGRTEHDFYPTPSHVTEDLLKREKFIGTIWECACGDGAMSKVLEAHTNLVISSDLIDRGFGETGLDFLTSNRKCDNIITNPPFKLAEKFVYHALDCAGKKVALFMKLAFLEGCSRKKMFEVTPLKTVYVYSHRVSLSRNGTEKTGSGMIAFAWFVWDKSYRGKPTIDWI
jgi:hypothetical protein